MYDSIEKELTKEKFMTMLEESERKENDGNRVEFGSEAYVCKVTTKSFWPDTVILGNEVGYNLDMKSYVQFLIWRGENMPRNFSSLEWSE